MDEAEGVVQCPLGIYRLCCMRRDWGPMVEFDSAHRKVHYPEDCRFRIWIDRRFVYGFLFLAVAVLAAAWIQRMMWGLPIIPSDAGLIQPGKPCGPLAEYQRPQFPSRPLCYR
jgi:hypothetical protein